MAIAVRCECGRQFRARDGHAGRRTKCPGCYRELLIAGDRLPDHDVFVSYSSKDKLIADLVCSTLESHKLRCWMAPRDIRPGMDWGSAIIDAIGDSAVMCLLYSGNSNQSPQVLREVERAVSKGVTVVPVRLEDVPLSKNMEYFISASHWLDAMSPPLEQHLETLAETIRGLLKERERRGGGEAAAGERPQPAAPSLMPGRQSKRARRTASVAIAVLLVAAVGVLAWRLRTGRKATPPAASAPAAAPAPAAPPGGRRVVDLLPKIDPARDTFAGRWELRDGKLMSDDTRFARIRIRYDPPEEYDFRVEFTRTSGANDVAQMAPFLRGGFVWQMDGYGGERWGLDAVNGEMVYVRYPPKITNGRRHVSEVRVRREKVAAYFDGELMCEVPARRVGLTLPPRWAMPLRGLALGTCASPTVFHAVQLVEVPGTGAAVRD